MKANSTAQRLLWLASSALVLAAVCFGGPMFAARATEALDAQFQQPPDSARPWVYWFIMDGNFSRPGVTADLEAMQRAGIGGVMLMEVDVGIPRGPANFMSEEWRAIFKHAVEEAERLGLQITLNAGPGWTGSGGPWVKPGQSMQHLVASNLDVTGPTKLSAILPRPQPRKPYFGNGGLPLEMVQAQEAFYVDVAVLAFPRSTNAAQIADLDEKGLFLRHPYSSRPGTKPFLAAPANYSTLPSGAVIVRGELIDLTDRLQSDGHLDWAVPAGEWTIMRFGRTSTGANTRPAPKSGLGLESDKFDPTALDAHFENFVRPLLQAVGPRPQHRTNGWTMLHIDSWEMGAQNWTAKFQSEFQRWRGYDPKPYLPVIAGRVVESLEVSERFLWDLRLTAQELVVANHARHLRELAHQHGFGLSIEPYDMNPTADLVLGAEADVPMGEFWANCFESFFSCIEASSIAHTGGKRIVAAESFTSDDQERWQFHPGNLKALGDWAFCAGINRFAIHRYAHQPWLDRVPGMTMGPYGVHWERTQTWWEMVREFHTYLARCQLLLRQGEAVADLLYLTPEGAPQVFRPPASAVRGNPPDRRGYNFDGCSPDMLRARAQVNGGKIAFAGGTSYRLLVLPDFETMTPALLRKLKELAQAGATIVGSPPRKSPSLSGYPRCDAEVQELANDIWGAAPVPDSVRRLGKGRIITSGKTSAANQPAINQLANAQWIWFPEGDPAVAAPVAKRYFRRVLVLPGNFECESARISLTADNTFTLWINGREAGSGNNFNQISEFDIAHQLKPGTNVIAVRAENGGDASNPAGLIATLEVRSRDGKSLKLLTDHDWLAATDVTKSWRVDAAAGDGWTPAKELGTWGIAPWGKVSQPTIEPEIYPNYTVLASVLSGAGVAPDFESEAPWRYTHRRAGDTDIYFVANPQAQAVTASATFRAAGRRPELWRPDTGRITSAGAWEQLGGRTRVPLKLDAHDSLFVIFRQPAKAPPAVPGRNWEEFTPVQQITGPWEVRFQAGRGAPERITLDTLRDWSTYADPGVKFFSGTATYRTTFVTDLKAELPSPRYVDLGRVEVMARVRLNGRDVGVVWKTPFRAEVSNVVKPGENVLEITVANLWPNRLIGDQGLPLEQRVAQTTWSPFKQDSPLLPSGLLGPVTLQRLDGAGNN